MSEKEFKSLIKSLKEFIKKIFKLIDGGVVIKYKKSEIYIPIEIKSKIFNINTIIDLKKLKEYFDSKSNYQLKNNSILYNENYYECLIIGDFIYEVITGETTEEGFYYYKILDEKNGIEYEISPVSNEYMILILQNFVSRLTNFPASHSYNLSSPYYSANLKQKEYLEKFDLFTNLRVFYNSIKIRTKCNTSFSVLNKCAYSFCFKITSSINQPIVLSNNLDSNYTNRYPSVSLDFDVVIPNKLLNDELVNYYQMAISSQIPVLQYLFFYLIIEYFSERSYYEGWVSLIKDRINDESFKRNENESIRSIINEVYKIYNYKPNTINELKALELTLQKYLSQEYLVENFKFDKEYLDYYKNNFPSFAYNKSTDIKLYLLDFNDNENLFRNLAKRIYAIRNSIVHSKETFDNRFRPFVNDGELLDEIPLIRLIAETIINKSGNELLDLFQSK